VLAPYYLTWQPAMVAFQKVMATTKPGWKIASPWLDRPTVDIQKVVANVFDAAYLVDTEYWRWEIPNHHGRYYFTGDRFSSHLRNERGPIPTPQYTFSCPDVNGVEAIRQWPDGSPLGSGAAFDTWVRVRQLRSEMRAFYGLMPKVWEARAKLTAVFIEPAGMWDIND